MPVNKPSEAVADDMILDASECHALLAATKNISTGHALHKLVLALAVSRRNTLTLRFHTFITHLLGISRPAYFYGETRSGVRFHGDYFDLDCAFGRRVKTTASQSSTCSLRVSWSIPKRVRVQRVIHLSMLGVMVECFQHR